MKVLVTGATGFIGSALTKRLLAKGAKVRVLIREPRKARQLENTGAEIFQGNITNRPDCIKACEGIGQVFHCAAILGGWGKSRSLLWEVNVQGTENMLEAARKEGIKQFIHVSTCGILGPCKRGQYLDEEASYEPINTYMRTKIEAEKLAADYSKKGLPVTIARPEFVYGPGDTHMLPLFRIVHQKRFVFFGDGLNMLHPTYIDDVVDGLLLASKQEAKGEKFNMAGERPVTMREFIGEMAQALDVPEPKISIPVALAKLTGWTLEYSWGLFAKPPMTSSAVITLSRNLAVSIEKARDRLGYNPKIGIREGIRRTVRWYRENRLLG